MWILLNISSITFSSSHIRNMQLTVINFRSAYIVSNLLWIRCDVKPSQRSGVIYKTRVAVKQCGSVLCGHCTCIAGLSEVCNHVGAVLYKTMHVVTTTSELSCRSLLNAWQLLRRLFHQLRLKTSTLDLTK